MVNRLYVVYNTLSKRYETVYASASDLLMTRTFCDQLRLNNYIARKTERFSDVRDIKDFELCYCGEIDIETGVVTGVNPVRLDLPADLDNLPVEPKINQ